MEMNMTERYPKAMHAVQVQPSKVKAIGIVLSCYIGFISLYFFTFWAKNYDAGVSALVLEIICLSHLYLTVSYYTNKLQENVDKNALVFLEIPSLIVCALFVIKGINDVCIGAINKEAFTLLDDGSYISAVLSFFTALWSFELFWESRSFRLILEKQALQAPTQDMQNTSTKVRPSKVKAIVLVLYFLFGWIVFYVFNFWRQRPSILIFTLLLEIACVCLIRLNVIYYSNKLKEKIHKNVLVFLEIPSLIMVILLSLGGLINVYFGLFTNEGFNLYEDGYYVPAFMAFLAAVGHFALFWDSKRFHRLSESLGSVPVTQ